MLEVGTGKFGKCGSVEGRSGRELGVEDVVAEVLKESACVMGRLAEGSTVEVSFAGEGDL